MPGDSSTGRRAATLDHVDPCGGNGPQNLVTCCFDCNTRKGHRTARAWRLEAGDAAETAVLRDLPEAL